MLFLKLFFFNFLLFLNFFLKLINTTSLHLYRLFEFFVMGDVQDLTDTVSKIPILKN